MIPGDRAFIIAAAQMSTVKETSNLKINYTEKAREKWDDPEALYYENFNCLCFQGHPESGPAECQDYFFQLIETYFN
jgi:carbamoylphosphate synthase small subunit